MVVASFTVTLLLIIVESSVLFLFLLSVVLATVVTPYFSSGICSYSSLVCSILETDVSPRLLYSLLVCSDDEVDIVPVISIFTGALSVTSMILVTFPLIE